MRTLAAGTNQVRRRQVYTCVWTGELYAANMKSDLFDCYIFASRSIYEHNLPVA